MKNKPLQIVMTPVRNEAWVLPAFLTATSQWADYIIVADQMSTDGSRELYKQFPKVIVIDNTNPNFNEAERQAMLVAKAREVAAGRDTLLWGLDADEVIAADAFETEDWQHILHSQHGDVFWFRWAEVAPDWKTYGDSVHYPWLFHDDGKEPHGNYVRNMHSMRIPYPIEEKKMYYVEDFRVLHLGYMNPQRTRAKLRFYQFVDWEMNNRSCIRLSRSYSYTEKPLNAFPIAKEMLNFTGFDIKAQVDQQTEVFWFDEYIIEHSKQHPISKIALLDIWTDEFVKIFGSDPRGICSKCLHWYLHQTMPHKDKRWVRAIDKVLRIVC